MDGKVVMVTGATNGLGEETALELARMGATVIVVGRNAEKCKNTLSMIQSETGNPNVDAMVADLSSLAEIRKLADEFLTKYDRLDVLVNNAGVYFNSRQESVDGNEMTLAVNHLNYFLLTHLLLAPLKSTAAKYGEARIVNVSSGAHSGPRGGINFDDIQRKIKYSGFVVYGETKLMNVMFTYELARRLEGTGISTNVLHPGFVATGFGHNNGGLVQLALGVIQRLFAKNVTDGASTQIYLASSPEVKGISGKYFDNSKAVRSSAISYDETQWQRLWDLSEELTGISEPMPA